MINSKTSSARPARRTARFSAVLVAVVASALALSACGSTTAPTDQGGDAKAQGDYRIAVVPKFTSDPYWTAVGEGAAEAGEELGVKVTFNGTVNSDPSAQSDIIDQFIQQQYDAIAVSASDADAIAPALKRAQDGGIKVSTFDSDAAKDAREVFLNQATFDGIAETITDAMVEQAGDSGKFLIVTETLTTPNMVAWIEAMKAYAAEKYPKMKFPAILPGDGDLAKSRQVTLDYLRGNPDTAGVFAMTGIATPGIAEAVEQLGLDGKVAISGIGVPSLIKPYLESGTLKSAVLWNPIDIGYAAVQISVAQLNGGLESAQKDGALEAGRLGKLKFIDTDVLLLGKPLVFTKENVGDYAF